MTGARPPREGGALCQGIIYCGSCGKPMRTNYHDDDHPAYECSGRTDRLTTPTCRTIAAATVDDAVAGALLDALTAEQALEAATDPRQRDEPAQVHDHKPTQATIRGFTIPAGNTPPIDHTVTTLQGVSNPLRPG